MYHMLIDVLDIRPCLNLQVNGASSLKPRMWTRARRLQTPAVASAPEFPHRPGENEKTTSVSEGKKSQIQQSQRNPPHGELENDIFRSHGHS